MRGGGNLLEASAKGAQSHDDVMLQVACFTVGTERYGVDIMKIKEVTRYHPVTRLPRAPSFIEGVIDLRGAIIPVVDMRKRLDLPPQAPSKRTRIIITSIRGKILGIIVDEAREVVRVARSEVKPSPQFVRGIESDCLAGVIEHGEGLILILDVEKVFTMEEHMQVTRMTRQ